MIKMANLLKNRKIMGIVEIILVILIISIIIVINNNKNAKKTSAEGTNINEEIQNEIKESQGNYIDINELENNVVNEIEESAENETNDNMQNTNGSKYNTPYYIKVNYGAQVVTIYKKDEEGNYTVPVKAMVCSTGTYTPKSGVYKIPARWEWLGLQGDVYGHYSTQIKGNILFHSVPYLRKYDPASLEYWEYDKLGTYASAGCIRLMLKDAKWIFDNCANGTPVEFYSSSNPGPLGKPTAKKISNAEGNLKNWDPTDPNVNNPWRNYKPSEDENIETNTETNTGANTEINTGANTEINTGANTEINTGANTETNTGANTETNTGANTETNTETNTEANTII